MRQAFWASGRLVHLNELSLNAQTVLCGRVRLATVTVGIDFRLSLSNPRTRTRWRAEARVVARAAGHEKHVDRTARDSDADGPSRGRSRAYVNVALRLRPSSSFVSSSECSRRLLSFAFSSSARLPKSRRRLPRDGLTSTVTRD